MRGRRLETFQGFIKVITVLVAVAGAANIAERFVPMWAPIVGRFVPMWARIVGASVNRLTSDA